MEKHRIKHKDYTYDVRQEFTQYGHQMTVELNGNTVTNAFKHNSSKEYYLAMFGVSGVHNMHVEGMDGVIKATSSFLDNELELAQDFIKMVKGN